MLIWGHVEDKDTKDQSWVAIVRDPTEYELATPLTTTTEDDEGEAVVMTTSTMLVNPGQFVVADIPGGAIVEVLEFAEVIAKYRPVDAHAENLWGVRG